MKPKRTVKNPLAPVSRFPLIVSVFFLMNACHSDTGSAPVTPVQVKILLSDVIPFSYSGGSEKILPADYTRLLRIYPAEKSGAHILNASIIRVENNTTLTIAPKVDALMAAADSDRVNAAISEEIRKQPIPAGLMVPTTLRTDSLRNRMETWLKTNTPQDSLLFFVDPQVYSEGSTVDWQGQKYKVYKGLAEARTAIARILDHGHKGSFLLANLGALSFTNDNTVSDRDSDLPHVPSNPSTQPNPSVPPKTAVKNPDPTRTPGKPAHSPSPGDSGLPVATWGEETCQKDGSGNYTGRRVKYGYDKKGQIAKTVIISNCDPDCRCIK